jgi:hypothetical protein
MNEYYREYILQDLTLACCGASVATYYCMNPYPAELGYICPSKE